VKDGRAEMYDEFRSLPHTRECAKVQSPSGAPCDCGFDETQR
jgi:hypothetical protein